MRWQPAPSRVGYDQAAIRQRTEQHRLALLDRRRGERARESYREGQLALAGRTVPEREPLLETERVVRIPLRQSRPLVHDPVRCGHARVDLAEASYDRAPTHRPQSELQVFSADLD